MEQLGVHVSLLFHPREPSPAPARMRCYIITDFPHSPKIPTLLGMGEEKHCISILRWSSLGGRGGDGKGTDGPPTRSCAQTTKWQPYQSSNNFLLPSFFFLQNFSFLKERPWTTTLDVRDLGDDIFHFYQHHIKSKLFQSCVLTAIFRSVAIDWWCIIGHA